MRGRIDRQQAAFNEALEYCRIFGVYWKNHLYPKIEEKEITGYYVTDETHTTTVKVVDI